MKLEVIWDEIVDWMSTLIFVFGCISFGICLNCIVIGFVFTFFSFISNGLEAFNLVFDFFKETWLNYKMLVLTIIILALSFSIKVIKLEINWKHFFKEVF